MARGRRVLSLLLIGILGSQAHRAQATPAAASTIQAERQTILGEAPKEGKRIYRAAVCADGTVHVTFHDVGQLITISPSGEILGSAAHAELEGVVALACDSRGTLYAGTWKGDLLEIQTDPAGKATITSLPHGNFVIRSMVYASSEIGLLALSLGEIAPSNGRGLAIHTFRPGAMPFGAIAADALAKVDDVHPPRDGTLVWDARRKQIVVVPRSKYEILAFTRDGALKSRTIVTGTTFKTGDLDPSVPPPSIRTTWPDQVIGAAMLPDGRLVVEFTEHPPDAPSRTTLHLLTGPEGTVIGSFPVFHGVLIGADANGSLYWLRVGRGGPIRLYKTRFDDANSTPAGSPQTPGSE